MSERRTVPATVRELATLIRMSSREKPVEGDYGNGRVRVDGEFAWVEDALVQMRSGAADD